MVKKIVAWIGQLTKRQEEADVTSTCCHTCQGLYDDIERIEQALSNVSTKPIRVLKQDSKPLVIGPVTERQRLMDLAG